MPAPYPAEPGSAPHDGRAQLQRRSLLAGGAVLGGAAAAWALPQLTAAAPSKRQDGRILALVLSLEYTEAAFYQRALERAGLDGELKDYATTVATHEKGHVDFLRKALGSSAPKPPEFDFGDRTESADAFARAAVELEDLSVATYVGQAANLTTPSFEAAAKIASVESRHAAWIRSILGEVPAVDPVDPGIGEAKTKQRLRSFGLQGR